MPAPTPATAAASAIGARRATLNGTVNPNGLSTDYWFEYWPDDWQTSGWETRTNLVTDPLFGSANNKTWRDGGGFTPPTPTEDWAGVVAGKWTLEEDTFFGGSWYVPSDATHRSWQVVASQKYSLSARVKNDTDHEIRLRFTWREEGGVTSLGLVDVDVEAGFEGWVEVLVGGTAPENVDHADLIFLVTESASASGTFYLGEHILEQREDAIAEADAFPTTAQLESGQAVFTGTEHESTSELAVPEDAPADKEGDAGEGEEAAAVSEGATGLEPGTTYHARLYASNEDGEAWGEDVELTTSATVTGALGSPGRPLSRHNPVINP